MKLTCFYQPIRGGQIWISLEVSILGADQKDRSLWERNCRYHHQDCKTLSACANTSKVSFASKNDSVLGLARIMKSRINKFKCLKCKPHSQDLSPGFKPEKVNREALGTRLLKSERSAFFFFLQDDL